ncbi:TonB-dependent receptor [Xanthomonas sp. A2111]|uniref:TonB-dependent receptor n=1 Tax=Xanthomonas hawaiiensis TaxID=3003247 RepID=A0ABU2I8I2_9XANT|nr:MULTISPECIES: TonB-dependent receptor [unclassified Xanthomonas]MBO9827462.1 TonB-dependent receptor [Xanthomonas sp. A2111]MBO9872508.1 TonB-dependent receptor [Xanthomonas sp. D-93]MDS9994450.1 TonB-dependent receptor [Xanthomonas sp. A2111]WNH46147.1 TonB-dependent receptor [Xanthomonas sp. A6251]
MNCKTNKLRDAVVLALVVGAGGSTGAAFAQDASTSGATNLDRIEVTGSRIRSVDVETAQPVFTVSSEEIKKSGLVSVGDILQNLTVSGTQTFSKAAVLTSNAEQGGQYVNLYNLGEQRTLVLVNGKRWTSSLAGYTDLSTIPSALIDRIEVLKDGASAIYGSDAVAGVVNIILRKNFEGAEASALFGQNGRGDGQKQSYSITLGASGDHSSLVFGASYTKEDPVFAKDRDLTRTTFGPNHPLDGLSATGPWGRFNYNGNTYVLNHTGSWDGNGVGADSRNLANYHNGLTTDDRFNVTQQMMLAQGNETKSVFTSGSFDLNENLTFKSTAMYSERDSTRQVGGYPLSATSQRTFPVSISGQSYYNPVGQDITSWFRRITEVPRVSENNVKSFHFDAALEGAFNVGTHGWNWDVGMNYNKYDVTQISTGNVNLLALQKALGPSFLNAQGVVQCGTAANPIALGTNLAAGQCTPFNILGGPSASTADALKYISTLGQATQQSVSKQYFANITGGLFDMPGSAGEFAFAAGVEHREVSGYDYPDQLSSAGYTTDLAAAPTTGKYKTNEAYLELMIPLLKDVPFAKELSFDVASRYSDYDRFGNTTNSKFSLTWKPVEDLLVRGTYGKGFRAPTLDDTFGGGSQSFDPFTDPCDARFGQLSTPAVAARCASEGLSTNFRQTDNAGQPVSARETQSNTAFQAGVGNAELQPEYSKTRTVGLVFSPHWVQGLDFSLDWYKISISNVITAVSATYVLNQCYNGVTSFCNYTRDAATGQVVSLSRGNTNLGALETEGYNFVANYRLPEFAAGQFSLRLDSNYLVAFRQQSDNGSPWNDYAGYWNYPRVRATLGVNWAKGDLSASWNLRYYGGYRDYCQYAEECNEPDYQTPNAGWGGGVGANKKGAITYQDVSMTWSAPWNGAVTVGARNVWNKQPPITYSLTNNSSSSIDPMLDYDRYLFMQYTQRF